MKRSIIAAAMAGALFAGTGAAEARTEFSATLSYTAGAPAIKIYEQLAEGVSDACANEFPMRQGELLMAMKWRRGCEAELMDEAVKAIADATLIALHNEALGRRGDIRILSAR